MLNSGMFKVLFLLSHVLGVPMMTTFSPGLVTLYLISLIGVDNYDFPNFLLLDYGPESKIM